MARALMGHVGMPNEQILTYEIARLRRRVQQLESELAQAREVTNHTIADTHSGAELELELHRIAEAGAPVPA